MSASIDIRDLSTRWTEVLAWAAAGQEVILLDGVAPRARLVPWPVAGARLPGLHPGALEPAPDFDAPLADEFWVGAP